MEPQDRSHAKKKETESLQKKTKRLKMSPPTKNPKMAPNLIVKQKSPRKRNPSQHPTNFGKKGSALPIYYNSNPYQEFILKQQSRITSEAIASPKKSRPLMHFLGMEPSS
jgi:hypothetical protein